MINTNLFFNYDNTHMQIAKAWKKEQSNFKTYIPKQCIANNFRDSFRFFKNVLAKDGNILDTSSYHRLELYCKEIELDSKLKDTWNWRDWIDKWQLYLYRNTSDHHTDLLKIISWVIVAIGCFGMLYFWVKYNQNPLFLNHLNPIGLTLSIAGSILALPFCTTTQRPFFRFGRYLTILSSILTLWIACYKPTLIFGAVNLIDKTPRSGLENLLLVLYTLIMILLLFSLQKTARKNSIIPS